MGLMGVVRVDDKLRLGLLVVCMCGFVVLGEVR